MLQSLHVHNFALLEDAKVDFAPGFNVFTGETGDNILISKKTTITQKTPHISVRCQSM